LLNDNSFIIYHIKPVYINFLCVVCIICIINNIKTSRRKLIFTIANN